MANKIKITEHGLTELSLKSLYRHCPLCGQLKENHYCEECKFKWEDDKLYFRS
jgi:hypothetical protein